MSFALAVLLCLSMTATAFAQKTEAAVSKDYANVFVHGLFGWGPEDGLQDYVSIWGTVSGYMLDYLEAQGYNTVEATIGPVSSCWDRCCELFGQLTGTRVDYGQAHVEQTLKEFAEVNCELDHKRYGRDYTGNRMLQDWGPIFENGKVTGWYENKINLIGHSFGGPTIVMFLNLLAEGDADERAWAQEQARINGGDWHDYCSPLFWGDYDGEKLVNSISSLAGVLNGTSLMNCAYDFFMILSKLIGGAVNVLGDTSLREIYDWQLEQFGITTSDNPDYEHVLSVLDTAHFFDAKDNAAYSLSINGTNELKQGWKCYDDVYYFAYTSDTTYTGRLTGNALPSATTMPILMPFVIGMGSYTNADQKVLDINGKVYCTVDDAWLPNDGMMNAITGEYVFGCPHKTWNGQIESGKWITILSDDMDHFDFVGAVWAPTQSVANTKAFFEQVMNNIQGTYSCQERLAAPTVTASSNGLGKVKLLIQAPSGTTGLKIYRCTSQNGNYKLAATIGNTSTWVDSKSLTGVTYYYKVTAICDGNKDMTSPFSSIVSAKGKLGK